MKEFAQSGHKKFQEQRCQAEKSYRVTHPPIERGLPIIARRDELTAHQHKGACCGGHQRGEQGNAQQGDQIVDTVHALVCRQTLPQIVRCAGVDRRYERIDQQKGQTQNRLVIVDDSGDHASNQKK